MAAALTFLLISTLLQGVDGRSFSVTLPQTVEVMKGSCVTVPCSFDIRSDHANNLNRNCKPYWVHPEDIIPRLTKTNPKTGDVMKKNCTTTFFNMIDNYNSQTYHFRLDCNNTLKWTFKEAGVRFVVRDDLPPPTLTPSTLKVKEGTSVNLTCSAPAPCLPHPPTLTWTPKLGESQESLQENQDKTKVQTSVLTFTASHLHHGQNISCTAVYEKQDGSSDASVTSSVTADISYSTKTTTVSVSPSGPVPENNNVTLTCSSDANPPVKIYTWYRADGDQETLIGTGSVLYTEASKVRQPFFCKAENDLGVGRSNLSHIDIHYSPKNTTVSVSPSGPVLENSNVTLTCSSDANPPVKNYTWYRADGDQEALIGTGSVLNTEVSTLRQDFFCKAGNYLGVGRSNLSHVDVQYSPKNTTVSVSPSGPVPENINVTLTCSSDANPPVKNYTWYRADGDQEASFGTGSVLNIQASKVRRLFFCKAENDLGVGHSNKSVIDVQFPPQILPSSDCTKTSSTINCSCEAVGNPSPTLRWYLNGQPVNQSNVYESLNDSSLRSVVTVNQPQENLPVLSCHSFNSLGSASQQFCFNSHEISAGKQDKILFPVFIATVVGLFVLVCVLLFVISFQRNQHKSQLRGEIIPVPSGQHLITEENRVPNTTGDIYASADELRQPDVAFPATTSDQNSSSLQSSGPNNAEGASDSSGKDEGGNDVIYSNVNWKSKSKKKDRKDSEDMNPSGGSYLEEEKCETGDVVNNFLSDALEMGDLYGKVEPRSKRKEVDCEYAQVRFKKKNDKKCT